MDLVYSNFKDSMKNNYLTELSGLLQSLLPGDVVLADREFIAQECLSMFFTEMEISLLQRKKTVEQTRS